MSRPGGLLLLVGLKLRLTSRVFSRRRKGALALTVVAFLLVTLTFAPMWLGLTAAAYFGARRLGSDAVAVGFGLIHITWIAGSLLLSSFAEGIDLRALLRYPVRPRSVFWLNVLIAPLDVVALFLLPPLAAMAVGTSARSGAVAGTAVAVAGVLLL